MCITSQYLPCTKAHFKEWNSYLMLLGRWRTWDQRHMGIPNTTLLLKDCRKKMTPNDILLYTYRFMSWPSWLTIIRDASYSRWEQTQRTTRTMCRFRNLGTPSPKSDVFTKWLPSGFRELQKSQWEGRQQGNQGLLETSRLMHIWTHRDWQCTQDLHGSKPNGIQVVKREVDTSHDP